MKRKLLYRVKFQEKTDKEPITVVVESFGSSDVLGMVTLEGFVFQDSTKLVVLPNEDEAKKRYESTEKLHLPYHVLLSVEEFYEGGEPASIQVLHPENESDQGEDSPEGTGPSPN